VVSSGTGTAVFTLGGAPLVCTGATAGGIYTVGTPLTPSNILTIQVNVTNVGTYLLAATSTGGFAFGAAGVFTTTGLQNVTLNGAGTPTTAGIAAVTVTNIASICSFIINVQPAGGPPAVFTLDGAPNGCTNFTVNGTYNAGVLTSAANSVILNVNVTTAGSYTITTNTVNGITFTKTGTFVATGPQTITLNATGTPTVSGSFTFTTNIAGSCSFSITVLGTLPPAVFTLSGAPAACAPITVNGTYAVGTALVAANTAIVQVNVSTIGTYTLSTATVNGMIFSKSGTFTATGLQNVTLQGSGTPLVAATNILIPQIGASSCTFPVTVTAAATGIFQCKINGVLNTFTDLADATYFVPGDLLISGGKLYSSFPDEFVLDIDKSSTGGTVTIGTYVNTLAGSIAGGYILGADYTDGTNAIWSPASIISPTPDPFTIIITSLTATRVIGTFSGTVRDNFGTGTNTKTITEGVFNLPIN
jgi:hypothetical protein